MIGANLLVMVTRYGHEKDYVLDKLDECLAECVLPVPGVDVIWAGDRPGDEISIPPGRVFTDDIVTNPRHQSLTLAYEGGYDKVLWQGVDALYRSRDDFVRLITHDVPIVSALISARTITDFACARRWKLDEEGGLTPCQDDVPVKELRSGKLVKAGWPSADNIVIRKELFGIDVLRPDLYVPWYRREFSPLPAGNSRDPAAGAGRHASSERFCYEAAKRGVQAWIDTSVKVWHVHESGASGTNGPLARLWPDVEVPMEELTWPHEFT